MVTGFQIALRRSNGNLHVSPRGDLDGNTALQLVNLLHEQYDGNGRVFIDTNKLATIFPHGCSTFQSWLNPKRIPADRLFFKGEKGYELAPNGSKVIVASPVHRCGCKGDCANCMCSRMKRRN